MVHLPLSPRPRVSVIILAWRHEELLRRCLASIARSTGPALPYETVVVLNGASPEVVQCVESDATGLRIVRSTVNLGFAGGCNRGAAVARGEYLLLLNDDTEVEPGWMESLVATADGHGDVAAVGSMLLFPGGLVQEAGCVLWRDGTTSTVGRHGLPSDAFCAAVREVDYCSGCSLLVRRSEWDAVGGMDEHYFPGYYEDVDLCLSIRGLGHRILFQPASRVMHHESTSLDPEFKEFVWNRSYNRFKQRWREELDKKLEPSEPAAMKRAVERARARPRRVLLVDPAALRGPRARFAEVLTAVRSLTAGGWGVTVAPGAEASATPGERIFDLGQAGVDVAPGRLDDHLRSGPCYEAVVVVATGPFADAALRVRALQPQAALICYEVGSPGEARGDAGAAATPAPGVSLTDVDWIVCCSHERAGWFQKAAGRAVPSAVIGSAGSSAAWDRALRDAIRVRSHARRQFRSSRRAAQRAHDDRPAAEQHA